MTNYARLDYGPDELQAVMREHYDKLIAFASSPGFKLVFEDLMQLHPQHRPAFVQNVLLDAAKLAAYGVKVPEGILIQRSAFGDRRPTLFAVKHFLPEKYRNVWENVNLTFDNEHTDDSVSRDKDVCWRAPLQPTLQAAAIAHTA
jgi:hypothetical protein